jgi:transcription elongation factor Elf1
LSQSRYIRTRRTPLHKKKNVRRLVGSFEDSGKYFKCWVCGAINSIERNIGFDGYGTTCVDIIQEDITKQSNKLTLDSVDMIGTMIKLGQDSLPITTYYTPREVQTIFGCWSCGSTNIY